MIRMARRRRYGQSPMIDSPGPNWRSGQRCESRRLDAEIAAFDKQLAPFAGLDDELARLEETRTRTSAGHMRYLRHEQLAAQHGERKKAHAAAEQQARAAATRLQKAAHDFERRGRRSTRRGWRR